MRELRRHLRRAGDDLTDLKQANGEAARIAADAAASRINSKSGTLARTVRSSGTKTAGVVRAGNNGGVRYAGVNAWGWGRKNIKGNPWPSDGARKSEARWRRVYADYLDRVIAQIKGN